MKQVCEVAVVEKLASSGTDISALDAEQTSSWSLKSGCNELAADESTARVAPPTAKVEAVTLMLTVQPGITTTTAAVMLLCWMDVCVLAKQLSDLDQLRV